LHWDLFTSSLNGIFAADRTEPMIVILPKTSIGIIGAATNYSGRPLVVGRPQPLARTSFLTAIEAIRGIWGTSACGRKFPAPKTVSQYLLVTDKVVDEKAFTELPAAVPPWF
jgi:hypothetical protein